MLPDADGNSKNDRYRASKIKINEEYVITCSMDMKQLTTRLFQKYANEITPEEIEYYRKNLRPSRLQQQMIEIYFFNYTSSSAEFAMLRDADWYKMLLIMRKDLMRRFNVTTDTLVDSALIVTLTANIEENPVGEKVYVKDTRFLDKDPDYNLLVDKYYSTITDMNPDIIKKFLITFANSKYRYVLYEDQSLLGEEIPINKRDLMDGMKTFLLAANSSISLENLLEE